MRKVRLLIVFLLCMAMTFGLSFCKKDINFTIKGRLLLSCDKPIPMAETDLQLCGSENGFLCRQNDPMFVLTDADSYFEFDVKQNFCGNLQVWCKTQNTKNYIQLADSIIFNQPYDLGTLYLENNATWINRIKTSQPYTAADTLFYNITYIDRGYKDSTYDFITGPFTDGQVVDTTVTTLMAYYKELHGYGLVWSGWILKSNTGVKRRFYSSPVRLCFKYRDMVMDLDK